jgi:hypothetical protein
MHCQTLPDSSRTLPRALPHTAARTATLQFGELTVLAQNLSQQRKAVENFKL